ncbi:type II secretion system F family protein, partial [Nanoarchaeota archaeon]
QTKKIKPLKPKLSSLEKETLKRFKKKEKKIIKSKERKASKYVQISNNLFSNFSKKILSPKITKDIKTNLIKANLLFLPQSYLSVIFFTTLLSVITSFFLLIFFLFFNIGPQFPIITLSKESLALRFTKVIWIIIILPIFTFIMMYFYPALEAKSAEKKINQELPFATIHMASIAGTIIEPTNIFSIILITKEYPNIEKEFKKLLNEINLFGYDLITALRHSAVNSPSKKLAELFNGVATTINSGGNLEEFFSKRAESLLFEYRIEREKRTRSAETFMDIYISVVIAAPMILMLLLMMMKISGLGLQLSTGMITLIMILAVTGINIGFLTFLHLKQTSGGG